MSLMRHHSLLRGVQPFELPVLVQSKEQALNASNTHTFTFATVPAQGDLIVLVCGTTQDRTQTCPGFNLHADVAGRLAVLYRIAVEGESNSYPISIPGTFNSWVIGMTFRNFSPFNPLSTSYSANTGTSTIFTTSLQTRLRKQFSFVADSHSQTSIVSYSDGYTGLGTVNARLHVAYKAFPETETSTNVTFTYGVAIGHFVIQVIVNPITK